jgi:hypothetical protein
MKAGLFCSRLLEVDLCSITNALLSHGCRVLDELDNYGRLGCELSN